MADTIPSSNEEDVVNNTDIEHGVEVDPKGEENKIEDEEWTLEWPMYTDGSSGKRRPLTTSTSRQILTATIEAARTELPKEVEEALALLSSTSSSSESWRSSYDVVYERIALMQARASIPTCRAMCQAGLDKAKELFVLRKRSSDSDSFETRLLKHVDSSSSTDTAVLTLETKEYTNAGCTTDHADFPLEMSSQASSLSSPVLLTGEDAVNQVNCWLQYGCLEESAARRACNTFLRNRQTAPGETDMDNMENSNLTHQQTQQTNTIYCVLGITSELAPTKPLLRYVPNATVMGVARNVNPIIEWYLATCCNSTSTTDASAESTTTDKTEDTTNTTTPPSTTTTTAAPNTKLQVTSADLLKQFPAVGEWIVRTVLDSVQKTQRPTNLVLLPMGYMDGEACVRLTMAMDHIIMYVIDKLQELHPPQQPQTQQPLDQHCTPCKIDVTVAYWISPSTVYPIPHDAASDSYRRYQEDMAASSSSTQSSLLPSWLRPLSKPQRWLSLLSFGKLLKPNSVVREKLAEAARTTPDAASTSDPPNATGTPATSTTYHVLNAVSNLQGPNYLLSKTLQQWRCIVIHSQQLLGQTNTTDQSEYPKIRVVAPHAPPTRTISVTHNDQAAAAIEGMPFVAKPLLTFDVGSCSTLLTAILLDFISDNGSSINDNMPSTPSSTTTSERLWNVFWDGSVHGGIWRCPYSCDSVGILGYIVGMYRIYVTNQRGINPADSFYISSYNVSPTPPATSPSDISKYEAAAARYRDEMM